MDAFVHVLDGFSVSLQPGNLWYTFVGVLMGTVIGVLPGIGPSAAMALLIPFCYDLNATSALIMMAGVYYGAQYGGAITSILINTPGESSSVMTAIDGYQMARKGRAGAALAVSAWGSFIGGTVGIVALTLLAVPLTKAALGADKKLITGVSVFDVFEGASLGADKKSIAIEVAIQPVEKTLTDEDFEALARRIVDNVAKQTGGVLRG